MQEVADSDQKTEGDSDQEESEDDSLFVYSVKLSCVPADEQFHEVIVVEDTEVRFQLDSGTKANVVTEELQQSQAKTTADKDEHCVDFLL